MINNMKQILVYELKILPYELELKIHKLNHEINFRKTINLINKIFKIKTYESHYESHYEKI